jgi:glutaredoxin-related protein
MFIIEKQQAFRDIENLVNSASIFLFIKGTLEEPKCKFTRKLIAEMKP